MRAFESFHGATGHTHCKVKWSGAHFPHDNAAVGPRLDEEKRLFVPVPVAAKMLTGGFKGQFVVRDYQVARWPRAEELGVSAGSLLDGPEEIKETTDDAVWLVEVEAKPESRAAGYDETFSRRLRIPRELLPDPNINPLYCQMVRIEGNKLQPDFPDGTIVFVDRLRRELEDGKTFMLVTEEGLLMRKVGFHDGTRQWTIGGRNGSPDDFRFTEDIRIIGQVVGAMKPLL